MRICVCDDLERVEKKQVGSGLLKSPGYPRQPQRSCCCGGFFKHGCPYIAAEGMKKAGNNMGQILQEQVPTLVRRGWADGKADFDSPVLLRSTKLQIDAPLDPCLYLLRSTRSNVPVYLLP